MHHITINNVNADQLVKIAIDALQCLESYKQIEVICDALVISELRELYEHLKKRFQE